MSWIVDIGSPKYRLKHPIFVTVEEFGADVVNAAIPEFDISISGVTCALALFYLKKEIVSSYEYLKSLKDEELGEFARYCFMAMNAVIVEREQNLLGSKSKE